MTTTTWRSAATASTVLDALTPAALLTGRSLAASLFLISGANKIAAYEAMQGYMSAFGIPSDLLPLVIAFQLTAGLALLLGFGARIAALLLAGFSVTTALTFHLDFADQIQTILFTKNIAIAGGLLAIAAAGPGRLSLNPRF